MFQRRKYFLKNGGMGFVERSPEQMIVPTNALRCIALRCVALHCVAWAWRGSCRPSDGRTQERLSKLYGDVQERRGSVAECLRWSSSSFGPRHRRLPSPLHGPYLHASSGALLQQCVEEGRGDGTGPEQDRHGLGGTCGDGH